MPFIYSETPDKPPLPTGGLGGKIASWVDSMREWAGERLKSFISFSIGGGVEVILDVMEKAAAPLLKPILDRARASGKMPPELDGLLGELEEPTGPIVAAFATAAGGIASGGIVSSTIGPFLLLLEYEMRRAANSSRLDPSMAVMAEQRDATLKDLIESDLRDQGWTNERIDAFRSLVRSLLDVSALVVARRRGIVEVADYTARMVQLGYTEQDAEIAFEASMFHPSPQDLVSWSAREVYEPLMVQKYGLDDEFGGLDLKDFFKAGVDEEQARNFWRAHWEHPSFGSIVEMLRRGLIEESDVYDWFRLVEVPPYWRDMLIQTSYAIPTRVDVRRFWDMRTIDDGRLRQIYQAQGYHGQDLEDYILWTKVYVAFPDLLARYKNGWIQLDDVYSELIALGMSEDRAVEMIQTKIQTAQPERVQAEKDLTLTDLYKGVRQGILSRAEAVELISEMGYDRFESEYKLEVNVPSTQEDKTKEARELSKSDIKAALKAELISESDALARLVELRYTPQDARFLIDLYMAGITGYQDEPDRSLTKADVSKAYKMGLVTEREAIDILLSIGYDPSESDFILSLVTPTEERSPSTYQEFKAQTQAYRRATGQSNSMPTPELLAAANKVKTLTAKVADMRARGLSDDDIAPILGELAVAEGEYRLLLSPPVQNE